MADEDEGVEVDERRGEADEWSAEARVVVTGEPDDTAERVVLDERAEVDQKAAEERLAAAEGRPQAVAGTAGRRNPIVRALLSPAGARLTSWIVLLVLWQLAGRSSERFPTPWGPSSS